MTKKPEAPVDAPVSDVDRAIIRMQAVEHLLRVNRPQPWTTGEIVEVLTQAARIEEFVLPKPAVE